MPVEFISLTPANAADELNPTGGSGVDPDYIVRHARALDDYEFNYTLIPYGSSGPDPFTIGASRARRVVCSSCVTEWEPP